MRIGCKWIVIAAIGALPLICAGEHADRGLRFDSLQVLDLAARSLQAPPSNPLRVSNLSADEARRILAAAEISQEHATLPFSDDLFGCGTHAKKCLQAHERRLLAASSAVRRVGAAIEIKPVDAAAFHFFDWAVAGTALADPDGETHWYLGTLPGSAYVRIEVQFEHDSPGSFLINQKSGKVAFVHNGSDIVALTSDGLYLLTFNMDSPPLALRVAALDAAGPRVVLECVVTAADDKTTAQFKGWHAQSADLELSVKNKPLALRIGREGESWDVAAADPQVLAAIGFTCRH